MKICEICKREFSVRIFIDGNWHNLCKRKYCIECSPFKQHNTKNLLRKKEFICKTCHKPYDRNKRHNYSTDEYCNSCLTSIKRLELKKKCLDYMGNKCSICGYNKCTRALHFHHINPTEKDKDFRISGSIHSWEKVKIELDKCILVCSNCHAEIHDRLDHMV